MKVLAYTATLLIVWIPVFGWLLFLPSNVVLPWWVNVWAFIGGGVLGYLYMSSTIGVAVRNKIFGVKQTKDGW